jgi:mRNA interferase MazF
VKPGDMVLISLPQIGGGAPKLRPALLLADLPGPYQNLLLCGISTQLHQLQANWDERVWTPPTPISPPAGCIKRRRFG